MMYATVPQVRTLLKTDVTTSDTTILDMLTFCSARIAQRLKRKFEPFVDTKYFDANYPTVSPSGRYLELGYPLLELNTLTLGNTQTPALNTDMLTLPREGAPYYRVYLLPTYTYSFYTVDNYRTEAISVSGIWGAVDDYSQAWVNQTTLNGAIVSATATSVPVTSASALSAGMLIRVDSEYMRITAISTNTLTVTRGVNGTTATTHLTLTAVYSFTPMHEITRATALYTAYAFHRRGAYEQTTFDLGTGVSIQYPADIPTEVQNILGEISLPRMGQTV